MLLVVELTTDLTMPCTSGGWRSAFRLTRVAAAAAWFLASPSKASPLAPTMALTCTYSAFMSDSRPSMAAGSPSFLLTMLLSSAKCAVTGSSAGAGAFAVGCASPSKLPRRSLSLSTPPSTGTPLAASWRSSACRSVSLATATSSFFSGEVGPEITRSTSAACATLVIGTKSMSASNASHWRW